MLPPSTLTHKEGRMKTTMDLPDGMWRAAKVRAIDEGTDLRQVVIAALTVYLKQKPIKRVDR